MILISCACSLCIAAVAWLLAVRIAWRSSLVSEVAVLGVGPELPLATTGAGFLGGGPSGGAGFRLLLTIAE